MKQSLKTVKAAAPAQALPAPHPEYGYYALPCGSRIYPAGRDYRDKHGELRRMPDAGKWFLWLRTKGIEGFVPMTKDSIRYWDTPREALQALEECRAGEGR